MSVIRPHISRTFPVLLAAAVAAGLAVTGQASAVPTPVDEVPSVGHQVAFPGTNGKIVFARYVSTDGVTLRMAVMSMTLTGEKLTKLNRNGMNPSWSPDGKQIAFDRAGDIFTMEANGDDVRRVTRTEAYEGQPAWSPNGKKIVFNRAKSTESASNIWTMQVGGDKLAKVTDTPSVSEGTAAWSPNGKWISYDARDALFKIRPDGTDKRQLTPTGSGDSGSSWSPDGRQIVFQRGIRVYVMSANGADVRRAQRRRLWWRYAGLLTGRREDRLCGLHGRRWLARHLQDGRRRDDPVQLTTPGVSGPMGLNDGAPDWQPR